MPLQHVQPEQQVDVFPFHDGKAAGQEETADFDLCRVHAAQDLSRAHATREARVAFVDQAHDAAGLGAAGRHDGGLGARVDKGFDRVIIDFHGDVEHVHAAEDCE